MKPWLQQCLTLTWTAYLLLTSFYCLLAFLPYTYYALIKAPAYAWMLWFVHYHVELYWVGLVGVVAACWPHSKRPAYATLFVGLFLGGIFLTFHPLLPDLHDNVRAYLWSVTALMPILLLYGLEILRYWPKEPEPARRSLSYTSMVTAAIAIALLTMAGVKIRTYIETRSSAVHLGDFELGLWSLITHVVVAIGVVSLLNLIFAAAAKTPRPRLVTYGVVTVLVYLAASMAVAGFLSNTLSFQGWPSMLYAGLLAACLLTGGLSLLLSWPAGIDLGKHKLVVVLGMVALALTALILPSAVGAWDWNGVFQSLFTVLLWVSLSIGFLILRPKPRGYSVPALLAIALVSGFGYAALNATEFLWAKSLGATADDIGMSMELYASRNFSFQMAHHLLGNRPPQEPCGDLCRILRQYTNIRDAQTRAEVRLVDSLVPTKTERPNIFILVIDSMRPDYVGAYNPKVDFTPNIDAFAKDSIVFRRAYTQYAGTTLSEPAIWSGAMLLHAHYVRPFANINSLEKLAKTDGYQTIVSFDTVLRELLSPADGTVKLDTDKKIWNEFELCSTVQQLTGALAERQSATQPVLFYAQPMNVHMFARNHQPIWRDTNFRRPGFSTRIALEVHQVDECLGQFFSYLKSHGLYDKSIIILASDHGDATGELGRSTHSYILYPEIMRVPLIVHLPESMKSKFVDDRDGVVTLTDIAPSLYYLLGHRPIVRNPLYGRPLFAETRQELMSYPRNEVLLASDELAIYGLLDGDGRYFYATYDSPPRSFLFDLANDANAEHSVLTPDLKRQYDQRILDQLRMVADFYGYRPGVQSWFESRRKLF
jgi:hypothetical protein